MNSNRVSVVIPAYNCIRTVESTLRSVLAQTCPPSEIIIVNDASTDNTAALLASLAAEDSRIRILTQPRNAGVAEARNRGVREAAGEFVALIDSDDIWKPEKLEKQLSLLQEKHADFLCTGAQCITDDGTPTERFFPCPEAISYRRLKGRNEIVCSSVLVKRDLLLAHPFETGPFHEDYLCWLRISKSGVTVYGINEPLTLYRLTAASLSRDKKKSALKTVRVYQKAGLSFPERVFCMCRYVLHGLKRYL